jgi:AraC-like DNA-binding protein
MRTNPNITGTKISSFPQLDLAVLHRGCFLSSKVRRETYDGIASELCDYGLTWGSGLTDARAYRVRAGNVSAYKILYGSEVTIEPDLYKDFMLIHLCLKQGIEVETDGRTFHVREGGVFLSSPRSSIRLRWQEGCEQLLVRLPTNFSGGDRTRPHDWRSGSVLGHELTSLLVAQLNLAMSLSQGEAVTPNHASWLDYLEKNLGSLVAFQLADGAAVVPVSQSTSVEPNFRRRNRGERLIAYIEAKLDAPIGLSDLTAGTGLSRTQLNAYCQEIFDCSPMSLVRRLRLKAARADLLRDPTQNLTAITMRYGFEHQSRFAQYYRVEFGELPSDTKRTLIGRS